MTQVMECPKCMGTDTYIEEGPWIDSTTNEMRLSQTCESCGFHWVGVYKCPERIAIETECAPDSRS